MKILDFRSECNYLLAKVKLANNAVSTEIKCRKCKQVQTNIISHNTNEIRCTHCGHLLAIAKSNNDFTQLSIKCRISKSINNLILQAY